MPNGYECCKKLCFNSYEHFFVLGAGRFRFKFVWESFQLRTPLPPQPPLSWLQSASPASQPKTSEPSQLPPQPPEAADIHSETCGPGLPPSVQLACTFLSYCVVSIPCTHMIDHGTIYHVYVLCIYHVYVLCLYIVS